MRHDVFEGRIRKVKPITSISSHYECFVYGTERMERNGYYDLADDQVEIAKEVTRVPQRLCLITYHIDRGKIIRIEPL